MEDFISLKYLRQYGIVHQESLANLNLLIVGDNQILPFLLLNLAFSGAGSMQGGVYLSEVPENVNEYHTKNSILFNKKDIGKPLIKVLRKKFIGEFFEEEKDNDYHPIAPDFDVQKWPENGIKNIIPDAVIYLPKTEEKIKINHSLGKVVLVGRITPSGFYIGNEDIEIAPFEENVLTLSLGCIAGAILCQEIIRLTNCIRETTVLDQSVNIKMKIKCSEIEKWKKQNEERSHKNESDLPFPFHVKLKLGGEILPTELINCMDDEADISITLPKISLISRLILDSLEIIEEPLRKNAGIKPPIYFSFLEGEKLENGKIITNGLPDIPKKIGKLSAVIIGVGGIGTWLSAVLAMSPIEKLKFSLVDHDPKVEEHNLNRQVLYTKLDIGKPKVIAAKDALLKLREKDFEINLYKIELRELFLRYLYKSDYADYCDPEVLEERIRKEPTFDIVDYVNASLAKDFEDADVILSCPDNMYTRLIINAACFLKVKTMINAGIRDAFLGNTDFINPKMDPCMVERYGKNAMIDKQQQQCGGSIPIPSIVTTNAFVAGVQSVYSIIDILIKENSKFSKKANYISFDGKESSFFHLKINSSPDLKEINGTIEDIVSDFLKQIT